ncbi:hypothetical protein MKX03_015562, partial [Papaver bracteatum]
MDSLLGAMNFWNQVFDPILGILKERKIREENLLGKIKETLREAELIVGLDFTKTNERT